MLIYHQISSLSTSMDQIQKIGKTDSIYLFFFYLFIYLKGKALWHKIYTHSKLSKNFLTYSIMCCFTEIKIFSFEAAMWNNCEAHLFILENK